MGVDDSEVVSGEQGRVLVSNKVPICFLLCRIQLIISTISMITRDSPHPLYPSVNPICLFQLAPEDFHFKFVPWQKPVWGSIVIII